MSPLPLTFSDQAVQVLVGPDGTIVVALQLDGAGTYLQIYETAADDPCAPEEE